jgi:4-hydroxy-L-threonine phosphate dehydrogenase PdxA
MKDMVMAKMATHTPLRDAPSAATREAVLTLARAGLTAVRLTGVQVVDDIF